MLTDQDGVVWLRIEDAGYLDEEGRVWLVGRVKWAVLRQNRRFWSTVVEQKVRAELKLPVVKDLSFFVQLVAGSL